MWFKVNRPIPNLKLDLELNNNFNYSVGPEMWKGLAKADFLFFFATITVTDIEHDSTSENTFPIFFLSAK